MANPLDQVASWPVTAAVGVASASGLMETTGPVRQPFRWASVTKLLTALAALDAVQRGLLGLDEPAGPPGSTIRHLLAHASGLAFDSDAVLAPPGQRRIYSNRGIEIVAEVLAARSGQPFERLLADEVCLPLGMAGHPARGLTGLGRHRPADRPDEPGRRAGQPVPGERGPAGRGHPGRLPRPDRACCPASAARPTATGAWASRSGTARRRTGPGSRNSPGTFGHFGRSGSFLWVDPEAGLACVGLADRDFDEWAKQAWPNLADDLLAAHLRHSLAIWTSPQSYPARSGSRLATSC